MDRRAIIKWREEEMAHPDADSFAEFGWFLVEGDNEDEWLASSESVKVEDKR